MWRSFLGRRSRGGGFSVVLLIFGVFGCISTAAMVFLGAPLAWGQARKVAALPQPAANALATLTPGTEALFTAQLPAPEETGPFGLALYYVEVLQEAQSSEGGTPSRSQTWVRESPSPAAVTLRLSDGGQLRVQLPQQVAFYNAQRQESLADTEERAMRYVGYLPLQTLTVHGTWEGDGVVTAEALYAGSAAAYVDYRQSQPGTALVTGGFCGGVALLLLAVGVVLRFLGK